MPKIFNIFGATPPEKEEFSKEENNFKGNFENSLENIDSLEDYDFKGEFWKTEEEVEDQRTININVLVKMIEKYKSGDKSVTTSDCMKAVEILSKMHGWNRADELPMEDQRIQFEL